MKEAPAVEKLLWVDIETTGLSPETDNILEVAWGVADLARPFDVEIKNAVVRFPHGKILDGTNGMSDVVFATHVRSGLILELLEGENRVPVEDIFRIIRNDLHRSFASPANTLQKVIAVAGFSCDFDRKFLLQKSASTAYDLYPWLSHKVYDVSSLKLQCQSFGMPKELTEKKAAHRAAPDIVEAIEHAKACARWLASHPNTV